MFPCQYLMDCSSVPRAWADLRWGRGHVPPPPNSLVAPPSQIQKLADRSDVIFEVLKCSKMRIFRGSAPDPAEGAYSAPQTPS